MVSHGKHRWATLAIGLVVGVAMLVFPTTVGGTSGQGRGAAQAPARVLEHLAGGGAHELEEVTALSAPDENSPNMTSAAFLPRSSVATQSDLAFQGKYVLAGNYNGFRIIDVSDPRHPVVVRDVLCPGPQNDISVWGDAIVLSVDQVRAANATRAGAKASDCDSIVAATQTREDGWEGLRVFSLRGILSMTPEADGFVRPVSPDAAVYTKCGSHTHTGIPHQDHVDIYVASYPLRSGPDCGPYDDASDTHNPLHEIISIVRVDPEKPWNAWLLKEVPIDVPTFDLLVPFGFNPMRGCHDIQVHLRLRQAAAACSSVGQVWDISDPENPRTLFPAWEVDEPDVQFYHSALFSEDQRTVIFGDEIIFGHCRDGTGSGRMWLYDRMTGALMSSFQIARDQVPTGAYCSSHLFNNVPGVGRQVLVAAWYAAGITVVDFTDRLNPTEVGFYDPEGTLMWSGYWYNDFVYGNDIPRGVQIFEFTEGAPGRERHMQFPFLNPQTQK